MPEIDPAIVVLREIQRNNVRRKSIRGKCSVSNERTRQVGIVTVTMDVLAQMLHFPEGHRIVDIRRRDNDFAYDQFQILCEGPSLQNVPEGCVTPTVQYILTQTEDVTNLIPERKIEGKFLT